MNFPFINFILFLIFWMGGGFVYFVIFQAPTRRKIENIFNITVIKDKGDDRDYMIGDMTYEGQVIENCIIIIPLLILTYFAVGITNFYLYLGFVFWVGYPIFLMALRYKTFSDSNILEKTGYGYMPNYCLIMSILPGAITLGAFTMLDDFHYVSKVYPCCLIICGLVSQSIPCFMDYVNKIFPFELRSKGGYVFLTIFSIFVGFLLWFLLIFILNHYGTNISF